MASASHLRDNDFECQPIISLWQYLELHLGVSIEDTSHQSKISLASHNSLQEIKWIPFQSNEVLFWFLRVLLCIFRNSNLILVLDCGACRSIMYLNVNRQAWPSNCKSSPNTWDPLPPGTGENEMPIPCTLPPWLLWTIGLPWRLKELLRNLMSTYSTGCSNSGCPNGTFPLEELGPPPALSHGNSELRCDPFPEPFAAISNPRFPPIIEAERDTRRAWPGS